MKVDQGLLTSQDPAAVMPWESWDQPAEDKPGLGGGPYRVPASHPNDDAFTAATADATPVFGRFLADMMALHDTAPHGKDLAEVAEMAAREWPKIMADADGDPDKAAASCRTMIQTPRDQMAEPRGNKKTG